MVQESIKSEEAFHLRVYVERAQGSTKMAKYYQKRKKTRTRGLRFLSQELTHPHQTKRLKKNHQTKRDAPRDRRKQKRD